MGVFIFSPTGQAHEKATLSTASYFLSSTGIKVSDAPTQPLYCPWSLQHWSYYMYCASVYEPVVCLGVETRAAPVGGTISLDVKEFTKEHEHMLPGQSTFTSDTLDIITDENLNYQTASSS